MENSTEQSDGYKADGDHRVPMFIHLTADEYNQKQEEANAKYRFAQNVYVNLNSAFDFDSMTKLITFLLLAFI